MRPRTTLRELVCVAVVVACAAMSACSSTVTQSERSALEPVRARVVGVVRLKVAPVEGSFDLDVGQGHGLLLDGNRLLMTRHQIKGPSKQQDEPARYDQAGTLQIRGESIPWSSAHAAGPNIDAVVVQLDRPVPPVGDAYEPVEIDFDSPLKVGQRVFIISSDPFVSGSPSGQMTLSSMMGLSIDEITTARLIKFSGEIADGPVLPSHVPLDVRFAAFAMLYDDDPRLPTAVEGRSGSSVAILRDGRPVIVGVVAAATWMDTYRTGADPNDPNAVSVRTVICIVRPKFAL